MTIKTIAHKRLVVGEKKQRFGFRKTILGLCGAILGSTLLMAEAANNAHTVQAAESDPNQAKSVQVTQTKADATKNNGTSTDASNVSAKTSVEAKGNEGTKTTNGLNSKIDQPLVKKENKDLPEYGYYHKGVPGIKVESSLEIVVHDKTLNKDLPEYGYYHKGVPGIKVNYAKVNYDWSTKEQKLGHKGYHIDNEPTLPSTIPDKPQTVTITVEHDIVPDNNTDHQYTPGTPINPNDQNGPKWPAKNNYSQDYTYTVNFSGPDGKQLANPKTQTSHWSRTVYVDKVTGEIKPDQSTPWKSDITNYGNTKVPVVNGYVANKTSKNGLLVSNILPGPKTEQKDITDTVTYSTVGKTPRQALPTDKEVLAHVTKDNFLDYFSLNGSATYAKNTGIVTITPDEYNKVGSFSLKSKIDMNTSFTLTGKVNLGYHPNGADGIGFALHNGNTTDIGNAGGNLGIGGLQNARGFKLDTWSNIYQVPQSDKDGSQIDSTNSNDFGWNRDSMNAPYGAFVDTTNEEVATKDGKKVQRWWAKDIDGTSQALSKDDVNGQFHDFTVDYDGDKRTLTIKYTQTSGKILTWTSPKPVSKSYQTMAMIVNASTGGATNLHQFEIINFDFKPATTVVPTKTVVPTTPTKTTKPAKTVVPTRTVVPTTPTKTAKTTKSVVPTTPTKTAKPTKSVVPTTPTKTAKTAKPVKSIVPTKTAKTAKPVKSVVPTTPTKTAKTAKPTKSVVPTKTAKTAKPTKSVVPTKTAKTVVPTTPTKTAKTVVPTTPIKTAKTAKIVVPTTPTKTAKTTKSVVPTTPTKTAKPTKSVVPTTPTKTTKPSKSVVPTKPAKTAKPSTPVKPNSLSKSTNPSKLVQNSNMASVRNKKQANKNELPQTGKNNSQSQAMSFIGILLAMFGSLLGSLGIKKHRND